jgi:hypothetical protein
VVSLETGLEAFENFNGFGNRWLVDIDFLETTGERTVFFEDPTILGVCGRPDTLERSAESAGFSRLDASRVPPEAEPAPISV